jgi:hypothetical protein
MFIVGNSLSIEDTRLLSSANASTPAKPPPTTTTESNLSLSTPGAISAARCKLSMTLSRTDTASSIVFIPIAKSATPGMGKVFETEPAVMTIWSYRKLKESCPSGVTVTDFFP